MELEVVTAALGVTKAIYCANMMKDVGLGKAFECVLL